MALESSAGGPEGELLADCSVQHSVVSEDKYAGVLQSFVGKWILTTWLWVKQLPTLSKGPTVI